MPSPDRTVLLNEHRQLRDDFAMAALTGILASPLTPDSWPPDRVAGEAYRLADAMLVARGGT